MKTRVGVLIVGGALALLGCGASGGGSAGSCATPTSAAPMSCIDYNQGFTTSTAMSSCGSGSQYSASACTTTGRIGHCVITSTSGTATASDTVNFYAPTTLDIAMMACTAGGGTAGVTATFIAN